MSGYINDMSDSESRHFKLLKKIFKSGKRCNECNRKLNKRLMTVDHIIPVYQYSGSIYDESNWQVLCIDCHTEKNKRECLEMEGMKYE